MKLNKEKLKKIIVKFKGSKSNVKYSELKKLVMGLGFTDAGQEGSHHVFRKKGKFPISIQPDKKNSSKAKEYQVNQILKIAKKMLKEG